jgi:undecaprenyl-diphosphatase
LEILDAIILGIVQGLTEFLPVSSSGHLEIAKALLGEKMIPHESLLFTVALHFATALSTLVVFRKEVLEIVGGLVSFDKESTTYSLKIIVSMIPAALVGLLFEKEIESLFNGDLAFVGSMLILTAVLLYFADKARPSLEKVSYKKAMGIGVAQAIAILPGISRSGATIATSVLLKVDKSKAARFSFLMVVPLILGKVAKDLLFGDLAFSSDQWMPIGVGFIFAFVFGLWACKWMVTLVRNSKLHYFAYYCLAVGVLSLLYSFIH